MKELFEKDTQLNVCAMTQERNAPAIGFYTSRSKNQVLYSMFKNWCSAFYSLIFLYFVLTVWYLPGAEKGDLQGGLRTVEIGTNAPQIEARNIGAAEPSEFNFIKGRNYILLFISINDPRLDRVLEEILRISKKYEGAGLDIIVLFDRDSSKLKEIAERLLKTERIKVLIDGESRTFKRYGINGPDFAVLIDGQQRLVWYGDPFGGLSDIAGNLLSGKIDIEKLRRSFLLKRLADEYFTLAKGEIVKTNRIIELGEQILKEGAADPLLLNEFAWNIMTDASLRYRDNMLALRAARKACDAVKGAQPAMLDTYARALFVNGLIKDAIQVQQLAVELAPDAATRKKLEETLNLYKSTIKK
ncbi:MAG: hypothetical protein ACP5T0_03300 [Verrucomicrobiia bacterium]